MQSAAFPAFSGKDSSAESVDRNLQDWVASVHSGIAISLNPPAAHPSGRGVGLYLMEILNVPSRITARPAPLHLNLRYLVTSWSDSPEDAHNILAELAFAALKKPDFEIELEPLPIAA